jgi:DNA-binding CsgD family transcriptional regulator/PAS domain-containing protein
MISEDELVSVIGAIYEAGVDFDRWPDALGRLAAAVGANSAILLRLAADPDACWGVAHGVEDGYDRLYTEHYHRVNPLQSRSWAAPAGDVHTDAMIMPPSELARTEFFEDFLAPQGIGGQLNAILLTEDRRQTTVALHAGRAIDDSQIALYRLITPHLRRAVELNIQLADTDLSRAASAEVLDRLDQGILFVDDGAGLVFANRAAMAILLAGEGLDQSGGVLHGRSLSDSATLHAAIAACVRSAGRPQSGSYISLSRAGGRTALSVRVSPAPEVFPPWLGGRPAAILCVTDPEHKATPPLEELRNRFGLTRAQAALAIEILAGDGIQAAADRLSIGRATARTHLAQIFEKTGTQRQSELVRLLLSSGLWVRPA